MLVACTGSEQDFAEADIAQLHDHMQRGELSSEELVRWYIERVDTIDRAGPTPGRSHRYLRRSGLRADQDVQLDPHGTRARHHGVRT